MRSVAFYLPQYHPIPENDRWWGAGFTEWRNVVQVAARFPGHYQPHVPGELGFYDLRLQETQIHQAQLASKYGIDAFCYYHYWFNGRRVLERPIQQILESGSPEFPFMLCWANENWTRRWDGDDQEILLSQEYSPEDDVRHLRHLAEAFQDPRYVRLDGKPVFLVYKASALPDAKATTDRWRHEYAKMGLGELHLCRVESQGVDRGDPRVLGFDAAIEFQPDVLTFPPRVQPGRLGRGMRRLINPTSGYRFNNVYDYAGLIQRSLSKPDVNYTRYRGLTPSWDNSARRAQWATIFRGATPELFEQWALGIFRGSNVAKADSDFVFVNAWNEWAEGNHLEPDLKHGTRYLEAWARALEVAGLREHDS